MEHDQQSVFSEAELAELLNESSIDLNDLDANDLLDSDPDCTFEVNSNQSDILDKNLLEDLLTPVPISVQKQPQKSDFKSRKEDEIRVSALSAQTAVVEDEVRYIILIDMDAYYAQVEMKKHKLDTSKPMAVQQWNSIIAINYAAKDLGVKRSMTVYEALCICPELTLVHVSTFEVCEYKAEAKQIFCDKIVDPSKSKRGAFGMIGNTVITQITKEQTSPGQKIRISDFDQMSESSDEEGNQVGQRLLPSTICKTKMLSSDTNIEPYRRWWVEMRQKENQKVSLKLYRTESRKIYKILQRFSDHVEKASCDEAYLDVTSQVQIRFNLLNHEDKFDKNWSGAKFMGFKLNEGNFIPEEPQDQKLWLANEIAFQIRNQIRNELGYNASAGISHNKTVAKIACSDYKPNGQSVVPKRYIKTALTHVPIKNIRMLGGKLGKQLKDGGLNFMGDVQLLSVDELKAIVSGEQAIWIKQLSEGICIEAVNEKTVPKTASAIKTFKDCTSFNRLMAYLQLVCLDVIQKIKEHMSEKQVYPQSLHFQSRLVVWSRNRDDLNQNCFKKTVKMIQYDDFAESTQNFTTYVMRCFNESQKELQFPCKMVSITCQNFKPIHQVKLPTRKIDNIFTKVDQLVSKDQFLLQQKEKQEKLNQEIRQSKLRKLGEQPTITPQKNKSTKLKPIIETKGVQKLTSFFTKR